MQPLSAPTAEDFAYARLAAYAAYQWPRYRDAAHHRLIARKLEAVERGECKRLMIFMPPRHGKSMLASEFFPAWYLGRNPGHYVIAATYAQDLADDFGRKVRDQIADQTFAQVFPGVGLRDDSQSVKRFHVEGPADALATTQDGAYFAVGIGGPLTGRGAHLLLIDDPVKNREDADSEVVRRKTKDWYTSTAYTRLMPEGAIIVIQCMTGDTRVLLETGSEKLLRDVRPGDRVATYEDGGLSSAKVMNWASNGPDRIFEIRMKSGIVAKANGRHPFLVREDGELTWRRTDTLKPGSVILRATRGSGLASSALPTDARSQLPARGCVLRTTASIDGPLGIGRLRTILSRGVRRICAIATACRPRSTIGPWQSRAASAPSASGHLTSRLLRRTGAASSASTTATTAAPSAACSVTTVISPSGTGGLKLFSSPLLSTFAIEGDVVEAVIPAGIEEVFDVEIEGTANFIANGLVSHNTRWHEDDLAGWLATEHRHEGWDILSLPAISAQDEALWPDQYPVPALQRIKLAIGTRDWSALYQQQPTPDSGDYFKRDWLRPVQTMPAPANLSVYGASDYAVTAGGGDFTVHIVIGLDTDGRIYVLDLWRGQADSATWVEAFCDLVVKWKPMEWAEENGQIRASLGPYLDRRSIERKAFVYRRQFPTKGDKAVRAQAIRGRMAMQGLHIPADAPWRADFESELLRFPAGVHDDQVDALGLIGQMLDTINAPSEAKALDGPGDRYDRNRRRMRTQQTRGSAWAT